MAAGFDDGHIGIAGQPRHAGRLAGTGMSAEPRRGGPAERGARSAGTGERGATAGPPARALTGCREGKVRADGTRAGRCAGRVAGEAERHPRVRYVRYWMLVISSCRT